MLTFYMFTLGFGGVMLLVTLFAGLDHDMGSGEGLPGSHDADLDGAGHANLWMWLPLLSLRFWTFAAIAFGVLGASGTWLAFPAWIVGLVSALTGVLAGWLAAWLFQRLQHEVVTSDVSLNSVQGQRAVVILPVRPGGRGQVCVEHPVGRLDLGAFTKGSRVLDIGEEVVILRVDGRDVEVESLRAGA